MSFEFLQNPLNTKSQVLDIFEPNLNLTSWRTRFTIKNIVKNFGLNNYTFPITISAAAILLLL